MNLNQIKIILKRYKIIISILVLCIFLGTSYAFYIDIQKEDKDIKVSSNKKLNSSKIPLFRISKTSTINNSIRNILESKGTLNIKVW